MKSSIACLLLSSSICACAGSSGETTATTSSSGSTDPIDEATSTTGADTPSTTTGDLEPTSSSTSTNTLTSTSTDTTDTSTTSAETTAEPPTSTTDDSTDDTTSDTTGGGDVAPCQAPDGDALVYFDDFETVELDKSFVGRGENGFLWSDASYVSGSDLNASSGDRAARFMFKAGDESTAELRFDLGGDYREVSIEFRLYMPNGEEAYGGAAYRHRNLKNNKFFRLWPGSEADYDSGEKLGASLWGMEESESESELQADWSKDGSPAVGPGLTQDPAPNFLGAADQGAWQTIRIDVRAATAKGSGPGALVISKNGVALSEEAPDNYTEGQPHSFRFGYLLGYANSGFDEDTLVFVDDVCVIARP